jgi:serine/threonine-protein kinase
LAELHRYRAEWQAQRRASVIADVRDGLALAARALALSPRLAAAVAVQGALHLAAARAAKNPRSRVASAEHARDALQTALHIDGNLEREYRPLVDEASRLARL